jgi:hypothetical protein
MYCRVKWLSTDVSEVRAASILRDDDPLWWRQHAPLKRRTIIILHGSTSQKTILNFILAAVRTWKLQKLQIRLDKGYPNFSTCGPYMTLIYMPRVKRTHTESIYIYKTTEYSKEVAPFAYLSDWKRNAGMEVYTAMTVRSRFDTRTSHFLRTTLDWHFGFV